MRPVISAAVLKLKDFSTSELVTHTVQVAIPRKQCKTAELLVLTTNTAYRIVSFPMTLSDFLFYVQLCSTRQDFN